MPAGLSVLPHPLTAAGVCTAVLHCACLAASLSLLLSVSLTDICHCKHCLPPSPSGFLLPTPFLWLLSRGLCIRCDLGAFLWFRDSSQAAICSKRENLCKEPPANT